MGRGPRCGSPIVSGRSAITPRHCLAHLIRDAQYAIDDGDTVFAPPFKEFLQRACEIGSRRPHLADSTMKEYARKLERELDRLLEPRGALCEMLSSSMPATSCSSS
jgi:transposase